MARPHHGNWWQEFYARLLLAPMIGALEWGLLKPDRETWPQDVPEAEPVWSELKFCKDCNTGTLHETLVWRDEDIETVECTACGGVWAYG